MKRILIINGSASVRSSNEKLIEYIVAKLGSFFDVAVFDSLKSLPHFDPALSVHNTPDEVVAFRNKIHEAHGVIICTPEYIFSIPSGLKNAIEWCVSTTVFSEKILSIITASASGKKGHEELQMIMKTLYASVDDERLLLISGIKGKVNDAGKITDVSTLKNLDLVVAAFKSAVDAHLNVP